MLGFGALGQFALGQYANFLAAETITTTVESGVSGGTKKPRRAEYDLSEGFTGKLTPMEDETADAAQTPIEMQAPVASTYQSINVAELLRALIADELAAIAALNAAIWAERIRLDDEEDEEFLLILS